MEMKLCAIYNVWDDYDWLMQSVDRIAPLVDGIIVIWSEWSNYGEYHKPEPGKADTLCKWFQLEPDPQLDARTNETAKRNYGLDKARELGYTHFLTMDCDEMYDPQEFLKEKKRFEDPNLQGLVCRVKCYFGSPTLTIGYDVTLVPFIHKLTPQIRHEFNKNYPFAWTDIDKIPFTPKKRIRIDPTRSLNINSGVEWSEITMHHYSWCRKDPQKKIRNSTARANIERSTIVQDLANAKAGYYCQFYGKTLLEAPNVFGLYVTSVQPHIPAAGEANVD